MFATQKCFFVILGFRVFFSSSKFRLGNFLSFFSLPYSKFILSTLVTLNNFNFAQPICTFFAALLWNLFSPLGTLFLCKSSITSSGFPWNTGCSSWGMAPKPKNYLSQSMEKQRCWSCCPWFVFPPSAPLLPTLPVSRYSLTLVVWGKQQRVYL